ncbi:hypothetical protein [Catellatospora sp. NPDC049609]|uniref:hypothetical protein n=1 Tax=Catellatospora sp. NPDC049609 TaxID=3155505 RepID=UPI003416FC79
MLIVIGSLKGSPGASTLALALAATWPAAGPRPVLVEADPAGGQIGAYWRFFEFPGLWSLAQHLRRDDTWQAREHAIRLPIGVDVVAGQARDNAVAAQVAADRAGMIPSAEVVIADVGRLERGGPCGGFLAAADHVVVVARPVEAELALVQGRAQALTEATGGKVWLATVGHGPFTGAQIFGAVGLPHIGQVPHDRLSGPLLRGERWSRHWRLFGLFRKATMIATTLWKAGPLTRPGAFDLDAEVGDAAPQGLGVPTPSGPVPSPAAGHEPASAPSRTGTRTAPAPPYATTASRPAGDQPAPSHHDTGIDPPAGPASGASMVSRHRHADPVPDAGTAEPPAGPHPAPVSPFMKRIRRALGRGPAPAVAEPTADTIETAAAGAVGVSDVLVSSGLGLIGPGALDAARGMLVGALSSGQHLAPDARGQVLVPADTLQLLLGSAADVLPRLRRLHLTDSIGEAVAYVEEEIIRRSRIVADAQTAEVLDVQGLDTYAETLPQLLLIVGAPDPRWLTRLATAVALGQSVAIRAVIVGEWRRGTTLRVGADGATGTAHRLAVLDVATAVQQLSMLRAERDQPPTTEPELTAAEPESPRQLARTLAEAGHLLGQDARSPVRLKVLGVPAVLDQAGRPAPRLRTAARELMVYLVMNRDGATISDILEAIYPDATVTRASERLSTDVANLRRVIRTVAGPTPDGSRLEPVVNSGGHYRLNPDVVDADWWTITDEYAQVAAAPDDRHRLKHLRAALAEITGPLAQGCLYEWSTTDEERVRRRTLTLYVQTAAMYADTDPHQARALLEAACTIDPLSEALACRAMRAAAADGDADAVGHRLAVLTRDLHQAGLELSEHTARLAQQLLADLAAHPSSHP